MQVTYEGREYSFDEEKISVDEWRELKRKYKMTPVGFEGGITEADPDAVTFFYWVMLRQNSADRGQTLGDHLKPDVMALHSAIAAAQSAGRAAEAEEEPQEGPTSGLAPSPPPSPSPPAPPSPAPNPNEQEVSAPATVS